MLRPSSSVVMVRLRAMFSCSTHNRKLTRLLTTVNNYSSRLWIRKLASLFRHAHLSQIRSFRHVSLSTKSRRSCLTATISLSSFLSFCSSLLLSTNTDSFFLSRSSFFPHDRPHFHFLPAVEQRSLLDAVHSLESLATSARRALSILLVGDRAHAALPESALLGDHRGRVSRSCCFWPCGSRTSVRLCDQRISTQPLEKVGRRGRRDRGSGRLLDFLHSLLQCLACTRTLLSGMYSYFVKGSMALEADLFLTHRNGDDENVLVSSRQLHSFSAADAKLTSVSCLAFVGHRIFR